MSLNRLTKGICKHKNQIGEMLSCGHPMPHPNNFNAEETLVGPLEGYDISDTLQFVSLGSSCCNTLQFSYFRCFGRSCPSNSPKVCLS